MCYQGCSQTHGEVVVGEAGTLLVVHSVERCLTADYGADHVESTMYNVRGLGTYDIYWF